MRFTQDNFSQPFSLLLPMQAELHYRWWILPFLFNWHNISCTHVCYISVVAYFAATLPPSTWTSFMCDLHAAQEAVQAGNTQYSWQKRLYRKWANFCSNLLVNRNLQYSSLPRVEILQVYGHRVRHAHHSKQWLELLDKESFSQAWGSIAAIHLLDGIPDPIKPTNITRQLKTYGIEDLPSKQDKAVPLGIIYSIMAAATTTSDTKNRHISVLELVIPG